MKKTLFVSFHHIFQLHTETFKTLFAICKQLFSVSMFMAIYMSLIWFFLANTFVTISLFSVYLYIKIVNHILINSKYIYALNISSIAYIKVFLTEDLKIHPVIFMHKQKLETVWKHSSPLALELTWLKQHFQITRRICLLKSIFSEKSFFLKMNSVLV